MKTNILILLMLLGSLIGLSSCNDSKGNVYAVDFSAYKNDTVIWCDSLYYNGTDSNTKLMHVTYWVKNERFENYSSTGFSYRK